MSIALAVFVKTPHYSPVKTRLAADIGESAALHWYKSAIEVIHGTMKLLQASKLISPYWAIGDRDDSGFSFWPEFPCLMQPDADLGARMASVFHQLLKQHEGVILIGADSPQMQSEIVLTAARWLQNDSPRQCLGPSSDGGFWLFGANHSIEQSQWSSVQYSRDDTALQFAQALHLNDHCLRLPLLCDVDDLSGLKQYCIEQGRVATPSATQSALLALSRSYIASEFTP